MLETVAKIITLTICPFLAYGFGVSLFRTSPSAFAYPGVTAFIIGFVVFAFVWRVFKRQLEVICTFEHEITHVIFGLIFLKVPRSFVVTRHEGGYVEMKRGNFVITLAPYFFPTVSYLLLPLAFLFEPKYLPVFFGLFGASIAFHLASTWAELHWRQTDLHKAGIMFSLLFLPVANLIFYGAIISLVFGGTHGFLTFWSVGFWEGIKIVPTLFK